MNYINDNKEDAKKDVKKMLALGNTEKEHIKRVQHFKFDNIELNGFYAKLRK